MHTLPTAQAIADTIQVERAIQTVKKLLRKASDPQLALLVLLPWT